MSTERVAFTRADLEEYKRLSVVEEYEDWTHDYEDTAAFYSETSSSAIHIGNLVKVSDTTLESSADTVTLDLPTALEAIGHTTSAHEAIQTYIEYCPAEDWQDGKIDPVVAAGMLVSIKEKFNADMTEHERTFVATEATGAVHELATIAEVKPEDENYDEMKDILTPPCVYTIVDVLDMVEEAGADDTMRTSVEDDLKKVLEAIDQNPEKKLFVTPVERALDFYDDPDNEDSLGMIVTNLVGRELNKSGRKLELKAKDNPDAYEGLYAGHIHADTGNSEAA